MVALYMDECVNGAITRGLLRRSVDVLTVQQDGYGEAPDIAVLDRAAALGRIVFTNDPDFLEQAHKRMAADGLFGGIVFAPARLPIGVCVRELELIASCTDVAEWANRVQYIPM